MKSVTSFKTIFLFAALLVFGYTENGYAHDGHDEVKYTTHIKPLWEQKCAKCHGAESPEIGEFDKDKEKYKAMKKGPRMDSYTYMISFVGWPDTGAIMRRLDDGKNTKDGNPGNMYKNLGDTDEERQKNLSILKEWVGNWILKKWPDISKEEMNGIKVKY